MRKRIIKNRYGVTPQFEAIFVVITVVSATALGAVAIGNFFSGSNVEKKSLEATALEVSSLLTQTRGQSLDGSQAWFENVEHVSSIGLKADLGEETWLHVLYDVGSSSPEEQENSKPTVPEVTGENGEVDKDLTFTAVSEDVDGDQIRYVWIWGDGDSEVSNYYESGESDSRTHSYSNQGGYTVKVRAQDDGNPVMESTYATISIEVTDSSSSNNFPNKPSTPVIVNQFGGIVSPPPDVPKAFSISVIANDTAYNYGTDTTDPDGDKLEYGWDWNDDDNVDGWDDNKGSYYDSGATISTGHTYNQYGFYNLKVKARDTPAGDSSAYSDSIIVFNDNRPDKPVTPFSNAASFSAGSSYYFFTYTSDPDDDYLYYKFRVQNEDTGEILEPSGWSLVPKESAPSGGPPGNEYVYSEEYVIPLDWSGCSASIRSKAKDVTLHEDYGVVEGLESLWSDSLVISIEEEPSGPGGGGTPTGCCAWGKGGRCIGYYNEDGHCLVNQNPCFLAGSKILMADRSVKNIEEIQVGDTILNYDTENAVFAKDRVTKVFHHEPDELIAGYYLIINEELKVTPNHPLYVDGEWVKAEDLEIGDSLSSGGKIFSIEKINERAPTYHMITELYHNYVIVFEEDYVIAINGDPVGVYVVEAEKEVNPVGDYILGDYEEEPSENSEISQLNQATSISYSSVLSMNKVYSLSEIPYSKFKEIFNLDEFVDVSIQITRIDQEDQEFLSYHPDNGRSSENADQVAVHSENVIIFARQQTSSYSQQYSDRYVPCELEISVY